MSQSRNHFSGGFADHTLLKHAVLKAYLQMWAFKLLQRRGAAGVVYFVDAFAGAGQDDEGNPGSPLIACRIAREVRDALAGDGENADVVVIAIENDPGRYQTLETHLLPFAGNEIRVVPLNGTLTEHMDEVARLTANHPALYFLDPFGLSGLDATQYPLMLGGPHNEVVVLFSDIGAGRLRGVVHASDLDLKSELERINDSPSLFPEHDRETQRAIQARTERRQAGRSNTAPAARRAISNALGDDSWDSALKDMESSEAQEELRRRFVKSLQQSGADFVQVIPMRDAKGIHKYCLIHASKSRKAWTTMKTAVSQGLNRSDLSHMMRERIRSDLTPPIHAVLDWLGQRFAGQRLRWTDRKGKDDGTVKRILLDETIVFDFQCNDIKAALRRCKWLVKNDRVEICNFPTSSADG